MKKIALTLISDGAGCSGGECPAIYRSSDGRFFVQGKVVPSEEISSSVKLGKDEVLIETTFDVLKNIKF